LEDIEFDPEGETNMRMTLVAVGLSLALGTALAGCSDDKSSGRAAPYESPQQQLVDKARLTVEALRSNPTLGGPVNENLARAKGVLIFPNLLRAGFFVGAEGGTGLLVGRRADGSWSEPAFVYTGDASFGLQIGAEGGQVIFLVMNDGAMTKLINGNVNLGADVSVAIGPLGGGASGATTPNVGGDLLAFSLQQGIFAGAAIKGGVIAPRIEWNEAYYGPGATPRTIIVDGRFRNPGTRSLRLALAVTPARPATGSAK
jgi:lipid-binding SYLF domain-containing protein